MTNYEILKCFSLKTTEAEKELTDKEILRYIDDCIDTVDLLKISQLYSILQEVRDEVAKLESPFGGSGEWWDGQLDALNVIDEKIKEYIGINQT